jgi:plastocyanin
LTVAVGTQVEVVNRDAAEHTATAASRAFDTGTLRQGQMATFKLTRPGAYSFACSFHPFMTGVVSVVK